MHANHKNRFDKKKHLQLPPTWNSLLRSFQFTQNTNEIVSQPIQNQKYQYKENYKLSEKENQRQLNWSTILSFRSKLIVIQVMLLAFIIRTTVKIKECFE